MHQKRSPWAEEEERMGKALLDADVSSSESDHLKVITFVPTTNYNSNSAYGKHRKGNLFVYMTPIH